MELYVQCIEGQWRGFKCISSSEETQVSPKHEVLGQDFYAYALTGISSWHFSTNLDINYHLHTGPKIKSLQKLPLSNLLSFEPQIQVQEVKFQTK